MFNFFVKPYRSNTETYPPNSFILSTDNWDDAGYETKFHMSYKTIEAQTKFIGEVKIGFLEQKKKSGAESYKDATRLVLPEKFGNLEPKFFSLGQSPDYYEKLREIFKEDTLLILDSLNDLSLKPNNLSKFESQPVVISSLLRSVTKWQIKNQFFQIIKGRNKLTNFNFNFNYKNKKLKFRIKAQSNPPTNIHALIGRNGAGKTTILNEMLDDILKNNGELKFETFQDFDNYQDANEDFFSKVIYISYNVFGEYVPTNSNIDKFSYIGLKEKNGDVVTIKNIDILHKEFTKSLEVINSSSSLHKMFVNVLKNISESYDNAIIGELTEGKGKKPSEIKFKELSSGHAIVLLVIVNLIANVTEKTLILFDEPETHLHPPLLSALVRAINFILTEKNGICIFATHSPVLVQEIPKSCVQVVRRVGDSVSISRPVIESFGENVSTLTHEIFSLEVKNSGFYKLMKKNFEDMDGDVEDIIEEFNDELGSEAVSLLYSLKSNSPKTN